MATKKGPLKPLPDGGSDQASNVVRRDDRRPAEVGSDRRSDHHFQAEGRAALLTYRQMRNRDRGPRNQRELFRLRVNDGFERCSPRGERPDWRLDINQYESSIVGGLAHEAEIRKFRGTATWRPSEEDGEFTRSAIAITLCELCRLQWSGTASRRSSKSKDHLRFGRDDSRRCLPNQKPMAWIARAAKASTSQCSIPGLTTITPI